jgi:hypothetical protein
MPDTSTHQRDPMLERSVVERLSNLLVRAEKWAPRRVDFLARFNKFRIAICKIAVLLTRLYHQSIFCGVLYLNDLNSQKEEILKRKSKFSLRPHAVSFACDRHHSSFFTLQHNSLFLAEGNIIVRPPCECLCLNIER